jgi:hypothetical protein
MLTPTEADVLKTALTGVFGLFGAIVTAWAGVLVVRLKQKAEQSDDEDKPEKKAAAAACPSASEIAEETIAAVFRRTGTVDPDFWQAVRMWPRLQQALLGRHDQVADTSALVHVVPQIATQVKAIHDYVSDVKREREIALAAKALAEEQGERRP